MEPQSTPTVDRFFDACATGDVGTLRALLATDRDLVRAAKTGAKYGGWTGLHSAAQNGHLEAVRLLLEHGADPNAREEGDNTFPLHWAAAARHGEVARALLDAGGDVHGMGDVHKMDAIGWATFYHAHEDNPNELSPRAREMVALLVERGARHHIFSAMSVGDLDLIRQVVAADARALDRRMSAFEHGLTPLHFAISRKRYDIVDLLIGLGADLEARNLHDQTALETAMLRGDHEAVRRLHAAGAKLPAAGDPAAVKDATAALAGSTRKIVPMIMVPDVGAALEWYLSIGFKEIARFGDDGVLNFAMVSFGNAELMLNMHGKRGRHDVSLWFYTDRIDDLYRLLKARQFTAAQAALAGGPYEPAAVEFIEDLYEPFYGGREFGIRDLNGFELYFMQDS
jgi:ankyrin repeat protein